MFNALKDMYISYPFLQVAKRPDWFTKVKDARIVATFPAMNLDTTFNDDNIVATLTAVINTTAHVHVVCAPLGSKDLEIPIYKEPTKCPTTQSYFIVDEDLDLSEIGDELSYRLHPDCVLILQEAPMIAGNTTAIVGFYNGSNITAMRIEDGVMFYGAVDGGTGLYEQDIAEKSPHMQGKGLRSINGISGDVWIRGLHPVDVTVVGGTLRATVSDE